MYFCGLWEKYGYPVPAKNPRGIIISHPLTFMLPAGDKGTKIIRTRKKKKTNVMKNARSLAWIKLFRYISSFILIWKLLEWG